MAKEVINIRLPENVNIEEIEQKAAELGISRSAYITKAIEVLMQFDTVSFARIHNWAQRINVPVGVVLQNNSIKYLAQKAAALDVYGHEVDPMIEYAKKDGKYIVGDPLFLMIYNADKKKYTQDYIDEINKRESYGVKLSAEALAFRDKYELKQNISQNDDMAKLVKQYPDMADEIKLNIELNKKKV